MFTTDCVIVNKNGRIFEGDDLITNSFQFVVKFFFLLADFRNSKPSTVYRTVFYYPKNIRTVLGKSITERSVIFLPIFFPAFLESLVRLKIDSKWVNRDLSRGFRCWISRSSFWVTCGDIFWYIRNLHIKITRSIAKAYAIVGVSLLLIVILLEECLWKKE